MGRRPAEGGGAEERRGGELEQRESELKTTCSMFSLGFAPPCARSENTSVATPLIVATFIASGNKLKKASRDSGLELSLVQNPDILAEVAALEPRPFVVGFAAETEQVEAHARAKLERKRLDLIAANEVGAGLGFESADNALLLLWPDGREVLERTGKAELARALVSRIAALRAARSSVRA